MDSKVTRTSTPDPCPLQTQCSLGRGRGGQLGCSEGPDRAHKSSRPVPSAHAYFQNKHTTERMRIGAGLSFLGCDPELSDFQTKISGISPLPKGPRYF